MKNNELIDDSPQQATFTFGNVVFDSHFDSGNLGRVEQITELIYNVYISPDGISTGVKGGYKVWFYFSVIGIPEGKYITFNVRYMNNQARLFSSGMKPVFKCSQTNLDWARIPGKCSYNCTEKEFSIQFVHVFNSKPEEKVYFAFTFPFSYLDCEEKLNRLESKFKLHPSIYFHRETAIHTIENRKMELLTISDHSNKTEEKELLIDGLFPTHKGDKSLRPFIFNKPTIFFTARVHPGEVPGSLILNGVIDFLLDEFNEQSKLLRENFVFKIIPMLNPDGVSRGHYRLDPIGQNLNRFYTEPTVEKQPTIYATKKLLVQQKELKKIKLFIDFHAHACKKGCFMFGNSLTGMDQVENMALPKLVAFNSLNFDFAECSFNERMMSIKDKRDGLSREGAARVALYKEIGLVNCYTLECNYNTGKRINYIPPKYNKAKKANDPEKPINDINSKFYNSKRPPKYTQEVFDDLGEAVCIALLDWIDKNPVSRLPNSSFKSIEDLRTELAQTTNVIPRKSKGKAWVVAV